MEAWKKDGKEDRNKPCKENINQERKEGRMEWREKRK